MDKLQKQNIKDALIKFGNDLEKQDTSKTKQFTPNLEADRLIKNNYLAFLFAVILDQGIKAEKAWEKPYFLSQRLGHLDLYKIAAMSDSEIMDIFEQKPKLHRFPKVMAVRIKKACQIILKKYDGKVENIWNDNPRTDDLQRRFDEFVGIGQKKASMATNILARDFCIPVKDKKGIDVLYDIHVRKVFLRSGLVDKDELDLIVEIARELSPDYPGALDLPAWIIGREYCSNNTPQCQACPINQACARLVELLPE